MIEVLLIVAAAHIPLLLLPGPDSALVVGSAALSSRRQALMNTLGIVIGSIILISLSLLGVGIVVTTTPVLFNGLKIVGAAYLIWRGVQLLSTKESTAKKKVPKARMNAVFTGLFTELSNPKAILFYIGIFALIHTYNKRFLPVAGIEMLLLTGIYYSILSVLVSKMKMENLNSRYHFIIKLVVAFVFFVAALLLAISLLT